MDVIAPQIPLSKAGSEQALAVLYKQLLVTKASLSQAVQKTVSRLQTASSRTNDWAALVRMLPESA